MKKSFLNLTPCIVLFFAGTHCFAQATWQNVNNNTPPANTTWVGVDADGQRMGIAMVDMQKAEPANYGSDTWVVVGKARPDWKSACVLSMKPRPHEAFYGNYNVVTNAENTTWKWLDGSKFKSEDMISVGENNGYMRNVKIGIAKIKINDLIRAVNFHDTKQRALIPNNDAIAIGSYDTEMGAALFTFGGDVLSVPVLSTNGLQIMVKKPRISIIHGPVIRNPRKG
ncbi:MAG: hypothetical protein ABJB86_22645 [Bacteroidota bacterium]